MEAIERAVVPLDVARRATLRLATRSRWLTRVLGRRDSRIGALATFQVLLLFALSVRFPIALFFIAPILFGTIHLAADVRYLVLHRAPPRVLVTASVVLALAVTTVRVAVQLGELSLTSAERADVVLGMAWIAVALLVALRKAMWPVAAGCVLPLAAVFVRHAHLVSLSLVHVHNLVAIGAWLVLFRRKIGWAIVPLALIGGLTAVLLSGATLPFTLTHDGLFAFGTDAERLGAWLAPGVSPRFAVATAITFVFLQGVHYAAWIGWIPQDDLGGEGTPTFRMSVRALRADFGARALVLVVVVAVSFVGLAMWNVRSSVAWYMTLAKSHAWFECAFLAYFVAAKRRLRHRET